MENFYDLIKLRKSNLLEINSNCTGTALYLVGEVDFDKSLSRLESREFFLKMKNSIHPEIGYVVNWHLNSQPIHAGVIFEENPFMVLHRNGSEINGGARLNLSSLEDLNESYKKIGVTPAYKIPKRYLENFN